MRSEKLRRKPVRCETRSRSSRRAGIYRGTFTAERSRSRHRSLVVFLRAARSRICFVRSLPATKIKSAPCSESIWRAPSPKSPVTLDQFLAACAERDIVRAEILAADERCADFVVAGFLGSRIPSRRRQLAPRSRSLLSRYHAAFPMAQPGGISRRIRSSRLFAGRVAHRRSSNWPAARRRTRPGRRGASWNKPAAPGSHRRCSHPRSAVASRTRRYCGGCASSGFRTRFSFIEPGSLSLSVDASSASSR